MLSLLFKESLSEKQDEQLLVEFQEYPLKYEHDVADDIDMKLSVYIEDRELAQQKVDKLKADGFKFIQQIHHGKPFFHENFGSAEEESESKFTPGIAAAVAENIENIPQTSQYSNPATPVARMEQKPIIRCDMNRLISNPPPQASPVQYVTLEQFEELSKKAKDQLNEFSISMKSSMDALSASVALVGNVRHDHSSYSLPTSSAPSPAIPVIRAPMSAQFKAKNELIANGIRCEKCNKIIKEVEPITKLIMAVREHVMAHFDSENPLLKRFECRECPDFKTNFVDEFEKHLKKHGSMISVPEKRQQLTINLLTETHLMLIAKLSNTCFPEVFEKVPPAINTIMAVDTPLKAKISVFPRLDRLYCSKFNIPFASTGRASLPAPLIRLD